MLSCITCVMKQKVLGKKMPTGSVQVVCRWHKYLEERVVWQNKGSKSKVYLIWSWKVGLAWVRTRCGNSEENAVACDKFSIA